MGTTAYCAFGSASPKWITRAATWANPLTVQPREGLL
jgi:hypothetical protein